MNPAVADLSQETINALVKAIGSSDDLRKAITTANGPQAYDLEAEVKSLFPVNTPIRNDIPRVFSRNKGDVATHWQAITGINTTWMPSVVFEGRRGGAVTTTKVNRMAAYATFGLEDSVTEEARLAAVGYDDIDARVVANLIWALMISEEVSDLGSNNSLLLGQPSITVSHDSATTSAFTTGNVIHVRCCALTLEGYQRAIRNGNVPIPVVNRTVVGATLAAGPVAETIAGGVSNASVDASTTLTGTGQNATASVVAIPGAVGYAWYVAVGAATATFYSLTTINSVVVSANGDGTDNVPSADNSAYNNAPIGQDGIITFCAIPGNGAFYVNQATGVIGTGTPMTAGASANIKEVDNIFLQMWNSWQGSCDTIWIAAQELGNMTDKVFASSGTPLLRFLLDAADMSTRQAAIRTLPAGVVVGFLLNKYSANGPVNIPVRLHPYLPPGTMVFQTHKLPFPNANVPDVLRMRGQLDYHEIAWGPFTRSGEYGVYFRGVLQCYFYPGFAVLSNIGNG